MIVSPLGENSFKYSTGVLLVDSVVLLYQIYNYHPLDGRAGIHMHLLNVHTNRIFKSVFEPYTGIALSHLNANWLTVVDDKIYIAYPLNNRITIKNFNLKTISSVKIPVFSQKVSKFNENYQRQVDSAINNEHTRMGEQLRIIGGLDSLDAHRKEFASDLYNKDFISHTVRYARDSCKFIENVIPIGKVGIGIVVNQSRNQDVKKFYVF